MIKYKKGVNAGYVSRTQAKEEENRRLGIVAPKDEEKKRNLFRGLIGGNTYITVLGTRVAVLDTMWGQNIFLSLNQDELEVLNIALRSPLADVTERVSGGEYGSPLQLGDFGFFSENRLLMQTDLLVALERKYAVGKYFLSAAEWEMVETKISDIGHYSYTRVRRAVRGDTFAALAVRASAFKVAKVLMDRGVDPLVENDEGEDLVCIVREQYRYLSDRLHHVIARKEETQRRVFPPTEMNQVLGEENSVVDTFMNMKEFIDSTVCNLEKRMVIIMRDKQDKRRADLRNESLDPWKLWNSQQHEKANNHISECAEIKAFIDEKLGMQKSHSRHCVTMAERVALQHALTVADGKDLDLEAHAHLQSKLAAAENNSATTTTAPDGSVPTASPMLYELMGLNQDMSAEKSKPSDLKSVPRMDDDTPVFSEIIGVLREVKHVDGGTEVIMFR